MDDCQDESRCEYRPLASVLSFLASAITLYVGSYLALVVPTYCDGYLGEVMMPKYRTGGVASEIAFSPVQWVDRQVRCELWFDTTWDHNRHTRFIPVVGRLMGG